MKLLLILAFTFTAFNTGLIWLVQVVHYPGFLRVGGEGYKGYQKYHMKNITLVVGPSMVAEAILSVAVLWYIKDLTASNIYLLSLALLVLIWLHTALWAAPVHARLLSGYDGALIRSLININWWRTSLWSLRTALLGYILYRI